MTPIIKELIPNELKNYTGLFETLNNLRESKELSFEEIYKLLDKMNKNDTHLFVAILENKIVGCVTVIIEQKLIRGGVVAAHIEDVVTNKNYINQGIASKIINEAINFAKKRNCYKIILECKKEFVNFYKRNGFNESGISMKIYL